MLQEIIVLTGFDVTLTSERSPSRHGASNRAKARNSWRLMGLLSLYEY